MARFKGFDRRISDEFQEAQDDQENRLKRPETLVCLAGLVPKMCPKKVASMGPSLVTVAIRVCWYKPSKVPT